MPWDFKASRDSKVFDFKERPTQKEKKKVSVGLDEMWAPLSKHDLFDDLKVNDKGS